MQSPIITVVHMTSVHVLTDIRIFQKECRTLAGAGYRVILIGPGESRSASGPTEPQVIGVKQPRSRLERMLLTTFRVFWTALLANANIYHVHDPELLPWLLVLKVLGKTVVFDMHEDVPNLILTKPWIPPVFRRVCSRTFAWVERVTLGRVPLVCVVDALAARYRSIGNVTVVRNFPILRELGVIKEAAAESFTVGYVGVVCPERGSEALLKAAGLCVARGLKVAIELVGAVDDEHRRKLTKLARELGLESVRIHGPLLPSESWRVVARCHLGAALIKPVPGLVNALPTKALEYIALGKPVLASTLPILRQIVEETGYGLCVDPENIAAIALAIEHVARNPEYWRSLAPRAQAVVQTKWTWERESARLLRLYDRLLGGEGPARVQAENP